MKVDAVMKGTGVSTVIEEREERERERERERIDVLPRQDHSQ